MRLVYLFWISLRFLSYGELNFLHKRLYLYLGVMSVRFIMNFLCVKNYTYRIQNSNQNFLQYYTCNLTRSFRMSLKSLLVSTNSKRFSWKMLEKSFSSHLSSVIVGVIWAAFILWIWVISFPLFKHLVHYLAISKLNSYTYTGRSGKP